MHTIQHNIDPAVSPGDNFYDYACGGWRRAHPLTGEYLSLIHI